jgi:NOL1/NOP2/fmu family ribosome biogenesis protein
MICYCLIVLFYKCCARAGEVRREMALWTESRLMGKGGNSGCTVVCIVGRGIAFSNADAGVFPPSAKVKYVLHPQTQMRVQVEEDEEEARNWTWGRVTNTDSSTRPKERVTVPSEPIRIVLLSSFVT